jgi:2-polyprenyl-3-methyl-5-hydroxy-6-metoxy-1,4-benzoquinol methylase
MTSRAANLKLDVSLAKNIFMTFLRTAERVSPVAISEDYVYARSLFAYRHAMQHIYGDVMELGCGEGYAITEMAKNAKKYIAIDKYYSSLAKTSLPENAEFIKMRFPPLQFVAFNSYDVVICFQTIEHIKNDETFLKDIFRVLKPGGKLILSTPNKKMSLTRNPWHEREYTAETMHQFISNTFSKFSIQGVYGDDTVMHYYKKNKESVRKFKQFDILDLENRLPAKLWQLPYDMLNSINRRKLNTSKQINYSAANFFISDKLDDCLDFFVIAEK